MNRWELERWNQDLEDARRREMQAEAATPKEQRIFDRQQKINRLRNEIADLEAEISRIRGRGR